MAVASPEPSPDSSKILRKIIPVRDDYAGTHFFVKEAGKRVATPLLAVVAAMGAADLVFAVDSVLADPLPSAAGDIRVTSAGTEGLAPAPR
ncbi:hypothetical protein ADL00_05765 [Streptomyces sp. AS58]|nr:hypothetical protein ADL00_05765 [Streptomyces sp. AS58]